MSKTKAKQLNKANVVSANKESRLKYNPSRSKMPRLSFKSSFLVIAVTFITLFAVPFLLQHVSVFVQWIVLFCSSIIIGMTIAYAHCFIETKLGRGPIFWKLTSIISVLVFIIEFFLFGLGIYL